MKCIELCLWCVLCVYRVYLSDDCNNDHNFLITSSYNLIHVGILPFLYVLHHGALFLYVLHHGHPLFLYVLQHGVHGVSVCLLLCVLHYGFILSFYLHRSIFRHYRKVFTSVHDVKTKFFKIFMILHWNGPM